MTTENFETIKPIYVKSLFHEKNPKMAKMLPGFVYKALEKIICQNKINDFISRYGNHKGLDFADGILEYLEVSYTIENEDIIKQLPKDGRYVFVANHPLGGPDGIILISFLGKYFKKLKFPVNDLLMNLKNLNNIFIPINKHGAQAKQTALIMEQAYESDNQVIMFPSGMVSRKINGKVKDLEWQKSFVTKAIKHQRDVIPIFFNGKNSRFFYNLARFRKAIGLNLNLEMLLLPKETFGKHGKTFSIHIGEPIKWQELNNGEKPQVWAERIKEQVYTLLK
ncbi:MAG: 1-acyl-sn-glycerol-3-phosphate acyltransferase [Marinifilaceae bacterium]